MTSKLIGLVNIFV